MKEWQRTVILVVLLALAVGFLVWSRHTVDANFVQTL
jgi:hypothetical protein